MRMDVHVHLHLHVTLVGWMDGWMDGWIEERKEGTFVVLYKALAKWLCQG